MLCVARVALRRARADFVRRRRWLRLAEGATPAKAGAKFVSAGDVRHMSSRAAAAAQDARRNTSTDTARTAGAAFLAMLQEAAARRGGGILSLPWDPVSWGAVYSAHATWLATTQRLLLAGRLDAEAAAAAAPLEDLRAAVDFSRAAYGYAFLQGGMGSIYRYVHMQTVQRSTFDVIAGVSGEANNLAACALAGIGLHDVRFAAWEATTYRRAAPRSPALADSALQEPSLDPTCSDSDGAFPCAGGGTRRHAPCAQAVPTVLRARRPCHFLAYDAARGRLVLAVRGSLELGDLLTDLHAKPIAVHLAGETCHVHEGMLRAAAYVHCNTADALAAVAAEKPGAPLLVTGHSLGGGVAALVTLLLRQENGAPRALQVRSFPMSASLGLPSCQAPDY